MRRIITLSPEGTPTTVFTNNSYQGQYLYFDGDDSFPVYHRGKRKADICISKDGDTLYLAPSIWASFISQNGYIKGDCKITIIEIGDFTLRFEKEVFSTIGLMGLVGHKFVEDTARNAPSIEGLKKCSEAYEEWLLFISQNIITLKSDAPDSYGRRYTRILIGDKFHYFTEVDSYLAKLNLDLSGSNDMKVPLSVYCDEEKVIYKIEEI